jgi:hypothetical protein
VLEHFSQSLALNLHHPVGFSDVTPTTSRRPGYVANLRRALGVRHGRCQLLTDALGHCDPTLQCLAQGFGMAGMEQLIGQVALSFKDLTLEVRLRGRNSELDAAIMKRRL